MIERRRGKSEQEREETARAIVAAARNLFMAHGYRAVSTRQVAEAVGLTQPALYHHFATKEDLYVAVALGEVTRLRGGIERIVRRDGPTRERLIALSRFMLTTVDYNFPLMYHDMGNEIGEKARSTLGAAFFGGIIGPLAGLFAAGQAAGELRGTEAGGLSPADSAGLFMAFVAHFLDRPLTHERILSVRGTEASATRLVELLLGGLGARG